jgi:HopA1 effector protein family
MKLEEDLKNLLSLQTVGEYIKVENILTNDEKGKKDKINKLYEIYTCPDKDWEFNEVKLKSILENADEESKNTKTIDWNIRNIKPFREEFTVEKFWFKNTGKEETPYKDLEAGEGSVIAFKDGINTIFYKGEYLEGGEMYANQAKAVVADAENQPSVIDNSTNDENKKKEEATSANYSKFIYAYFPPKLYLSPNNKAYFILTQGKNMLRIRDQAVIRFYFNLKPKKSNVNTTNFETYEESAERFKKRVNEFVNSFENYLNKRRIPFQFKLPISLENFQRADTFVLYVAQKHYYYLYEFITTKAKQYSDILGEVTPLFTKPFANIKGVSIADDPDVSGDSFGINRCALIYDIIEKLAKFDDVKYTMTVANIITELHNLGYDFDNEFYRNPYTKYRYDFVLDNTEIGISNNFIFDGRWYLYLYGRVALNYALDLVGNAIWLEHNKLTWMTYYESDDKKEKCYRLVDKEESALIFWYLRQIIGFSWMRDYFPLNVIRIILDESKITNTEDHNVWERIKQLFYKDLKEEYDLIQKNRKKFEWSLKAFSGIVEVYAKNIEDYSNAVRGDFQEDEIEKIYTMEKDEFGKKTDLNKIARKIYYKYLKPLYPIRNFYKNYEYVPTERGKLQIAMMILSIYDPNIFRKLEPQQESSQKSLFQKAKSKLQVLLPVSKLWS